LCLHMTCTTLKFDLNIQVTGKALVRGELSTRVQRFAFFALHLITLLNEFKFAWEAV
jgi:hypothetical protein